MPVVHLDDVFWNEAVEPLPLDEWRLRQGELAAADEWILDGDLGPYDALEPRLSRADTVILLDFGVLRCRWRVLHRGRERADFWWWMFGWPWRDRTGIMRTIGRVAPNAELVRLRRPSAVEGWLAGFDGGQV